MPEGQESDLSLELDAVAKPLVLLGLMGAGKSTTGAMLARRLGRCFFDSDAEIESARGKSVAEIFTDEGEAAFRAHERAMVAELLGRGDRAVIALGGGAFMDEASRKLIKKTAVSIWLRAGVEVLWQRVRHRNTRPLLAGDGLAKLTHLAEERGGVYAEADHVLDTDSFSPTEAAEAIIALLAADA